MAGHPLTAINPQSACALNGAAELSFVDELSSGFLELVLSDPAVASDASQGREQRVSASPNWKLHPAAGIPDPVTDPFSLTNVSQYSQKVGLHTATPNEAAGIVVAVLDNGFDSQFWQGVPQPAPVSSGQDLIQGDTSTSGHGTLVAAIVASTAPGADVVPVRMAGTESTEWDTLHALGRAVRDLQANIITLSYSQILKSNVQCKLCGLERISARSEVFRSIVDWASNGGKRAILAARNTGSLMVSFPAAYPGAKPIAALDAVCSGLWTQSNWDASNQLGVLALPGEQVAVTNKGIDLSGTFATAYAAALYAVAMGRYGSTDASQVGQRLAANAMSSVSNSTVPYL